MDRLSTEGPSREMMTQQVEKLTSMMHTLLALKASCHAMPRGKAFSTNLPAHHWILTERLQIPRIYPVSEGRFQPQDCTIPSVRGFTTPQSVPPGCRGSKGVL